MFRKLALAIVVASLGCVPAVEGDPPVERTGLGVLGFSSHAADSVRDGDRWS